MQVNGYNIKNDANLQGANLYNANLQGANLHGANLQDADLRKTINIPEFVKAQLSILPSGDIIGWKKCRNNVIVKLLISSETPRSNATGRKCRAKEARVLEIFGATEATSHYDNNFVYRKGDVVECDEWNEDRWNECSGGIHFFITREEAESYQT